MQHRGARQEITAVQKGRAEQVFAEADCDEQ
uniref:Transposase n=1 Tax=Macrostomum lignano TaxID=282301 RepID=A0A1I8FBM7_9PLAT